MSQILNPSSGGGGGGGVTSVQGTAPIQVNGVSGVPQTGAVIVSDVGVDLHAARYIVSAGGTTDGANYTTIAAAYAAAVLAGAPQTVFLQPGTYTANQTLVAGINLSAFDCDALTPNVTILGKLSASGAGEVSISGINLQTNSDFCIAISGAAGTLINLSGCYITAQNNTAISSAGTGGGGINLYNCNGEINGNGLAYFAQSGGNVVRFFGGEYQNFGDGLGASTNSCTSGFDCAFYNVAEFGNAITTSNAGFLIGENSNFAGTLTLNNTSDLNVLYNSQVSGNGSTSAISIGAGAAADVADVIVNSSNTNAITGAGTLNYGLLTFTGSSSTVNTVTQTPLPTLPAFGGGGSGFTSVAIQAFSTSGTYTPTTGMDYCIVEIVGGGGGGGGAAATGGAQASFGAGGGAGEIARSVFSAATIGASQAVTIGAAGAANSGATGGAGGNSSLGALISANGGSGGITAGASNFNIQPGAAGGTGGSGGTFAAQGVTGTDGFANPGGGVGWSGAGGSSPYGSGGQRITYDAVSGNNATGNSATGFGSGGGGGMNSQLQTATSGGAGTAGYILITEYIS